MHSQGAIDGVDKSHLRQDRDQCDQYFVCQSFQNINYVGTWGALKRNILWEVYIYFLLKVYVAQTYQQ